jgi:hypothetical protein
MKDLSFKNILLTLAQAPIAFMLLLLVKIELLLTKILASLANPLLSKRSLSYLEKAVKSRDKAMKIIDDKTIEKFLLVLKESSNYRLSVIRKAFESTDAGYRVKSGHPDRHLYAVLRPTLVENLERIANVLEAMTPAELELVCERVKSVFG